MLKLSPVPFWFLQLLFIYSVSPTPHRTGPESPDNSVDHLQTFTSSKLNYLAISVQSLRLKKKKKSSVQIKHLKEKCSFYCLLMITRKHWRVKTACHPSICTTSCPVAPVGPGFSLIHKLIWIPNYSEKEKAQMRCLWWTQTELNLKWQGAFCEAGKEEAHGARTGRLGWLWYGGTKGTEGVAESSQCCSQGCGWREGSLGAQHCISKPVSRTRGTASCPPWPANRSSAKLSKNKIFQLNTQQPYWNSWKQLTAVPRPLSKAKSAVCDGLGTRSTVRLHCCLLEMWNRAVCCQGINFVEEDLVHGSAVVSQSFYFSGKAGEDGLTLPKGQSFSEWSLGLWL